MKATVIRIAKPEYHDSPRIDVRLGQFGREAGLDTWHHDNLFETLHVGDIIHVRRQTNNPYVIIDD